MSQIGQDSTEPSVLPLMVQRAYAQGANLGFVFVHESDSMTGVKLTFTGTKTGPLVVRLEDDVGTQYAGIGGGGRGSDCWRSLTFSFRGSIPVDANCLTATVFSPWDETQNEMQISASLDRPRSASGPIITYRPTDESPVKVFQAERKASLPNSVRSIQGEYRDLVPVLIEYWNECCLLTLYVRQSRPTAGYKPLNQASASDSAGRQYAGTVVENGPWLAGRKIELVLVPPVPDDVTTLILQDESYGEISLRITDKYGPRL